MQKVELVVLTKTFELEASRKINIQADSRLAFATAHVHGDICQKDCLYQRKQTGNLGPIRCPNELSNHIVQCPVVRRENTQWAITRQIKWLQR